MSVQRLQEFQLVGKNVNTQKHGLCFLRRSKSIRKFLIGVTKDSRSLIL
jgi:hypothetical protein